MKNRSAKVGISIAAGGILGALGMYFLGPEILIGTAVMVLLLGFSL